jgi:Icc-related predicted phosphoesterase
MKKQAFFVSDLHGSLPRYKILFRTIEKELPSMVFLGGDLLPSGLFAFSSQPDKTADFFNNVIKKGFLDLKEKLGKNYPEVFLILGNDDGKSEEKAFIEAQEQHLWQYIHGKSSVRKGITVYGYAFVPPTPFQLKDWERYDVSRYVCPNCVPIEEGTFSHPVDRKKIQFETIQKDLEKLVKDKDLSRSIFLFHSPPYKTNLDRAALDGKMIDHVPLDVHIGSIAIKRFIEERQPMLTLHGHVHESYSLTGNWKQKIGKTLAINAAHDGPELALVRFSLDDPEKASRELFSI